MIKTVVAAVVMLAMALSASGQQRSLTLLDAHSGLTNTFIQDIAQDKRGLIWVATDYGLNVLDGEDFIPILKNTGKNAGPGLNGNELNALLDSPTDSVMWVGTQRFGLNGFNYRTGEVLSFTHDPKRQSSIAADNVVSLHDMGDRRILVATYWKGFDIFDPAKKSFTHYNSTNVAGMPATPLKDAVSAGDRVVAGHHDGTLSVVSLKSRKAVNVPSGGRDIWVLHALSESRVLAGTDTGLILLDVKSGKVTRIAPETFADTSVFDIVKVGDSLFWVSTEFKGVFTVDLSGMSVSDVRVSRPETKQDILKGIGPLDNLTSRAIFKDCYGNMWIGV